MISPTNAMELLVFEAIDDFFALKENADTCHCEKCRADIAAIALNNLPPQYVVTLRGQTFKRAENMAPQLKTDVIREVAKAINIVVSNVHHSHEL